MINKISKNTVIIIGIILCTIVFVLNLFYVSKIENDFFEQIKIIKFVSYEIILIIMIAMGFKSIINKLSSIKLGKKSKIIILNILLIVYLIVQIIWIQARGAEPSKDSMHIYVLAKKMYNNEWESIQQYQYFELYPHQTTLSFLIYILFKIFNTTNSVVFQYLNAIANTFTVFALVLITKQLAANYKVSKCTTLILALSFITLPLLCTFVYGDIVSIPLNLFAIYFIIKYTRSNKKRYAIIASVLMAFAYICRMNSLIFFIGILIYLILELFKLPQKNIKIVIGKLIIIALFIIITLCPQTILKITMQQKLKLDTNKQYPTIGFWCLGIEETPTANGWYGECGNWAWQDPIASRQRYVNRLQERISYFANNPKECIEFYKYKLISTWTENTYGALWLNKSFHIGIYEDTVVDYEQRFRIDNKLLEMEEPVLAFQKSIILIIFGSTILVLIKHRKEFSNELLLLVVIFIGGFIFHLFWETNSRYIIPYIVVLIPVAAICIDSPLISFKKIKENIYKS